MKRVLSAAVVLACIGACSRSQSAAPDAAPAAPSASASAEAEEDDVKPVYPLDDAPADPLAQRLCNALHAMPEDRRAACCNDRPGLVVASECVRMLGAALRHKAVSLDAGDVDRCVGALEKAYDGCAWVGPNAVATPQECRGIVRGQLARGTRCRSALECAGDMYCHGVGPTSTGRCAPPHDDGGSCGGTVDPLVVYTRDETSKSHPECKSFCDRRKCVAFAPAFGACTVSAACGEGKQCVAGKCAPGEAHAPAKKTAGEACTQDAECMGGCLKPDGGKAGSCGMKCGAR